MEMNTPSPNRSRPIVGSAALLATAYAAFSCCMVPESFLGSISRNAQNAIIFHQGNREELILRINYQITGDSMPDRFAWIVTTPTEPDAYRVAGEDLFTSVDEWASALLTPRPSPVATGCGMGCGRQDDPAANLAFEEASLIFGELAEVGPYTIQPVRARGADALDALNAWLKKNGFPSEDPDHMKWFIEEEFTFLCIKVTPPEGKNAVPESSFLPPLQISFESEKLYYPLLFSARQGMFALSLYTLTDRPLNFAASQYNLRRINWHDRGLYKNVEVAKKDLPDLLGKAAKESKLMSSGDQWHLNIVSSPMVNVDAEILNWAEDVFFNTGGENVQVDKVARRFDIGAPFAVFCAAVFLLGRRLFRPHA